MINRKKLHTHLMASAASCLAAALAVAGSAAAEDTGQIETVLVTGLRASIESAIALKKNSSQVVEAVSMEDIGKLPDQSIAESISRLPGLATQRVSGRAQSISIRGLSPDFSTTLLNGREQVSTNDNRGADYDQYPSELMAGVVVYKTPAADLIGQGLSGTVDMKTVRPLDYDHRVISVNARAETGSLGKLNDDMPMYGYRASGTYVDQFLGNKLGVTIGVAQMVSPQQIQEYDSSGYSSVSGNTISKQAKAYAESDNLVRTSAMATVQFRPTEGFESTLDVFYTKFKDKTMLRGLQIPLYGNTGVALTSYTTDNKYVTGGSYSGVRPVVQNEQDTRNNDLFSIGWKNEYTSGAWTTTLDVSWSSVQRTDSFLQGYGGTGRYNQTAPTDSMSYTTGKDFLPDYTNTINYGSFDTTYLTMPQNWGIGVITWGGQDGYLNNRIVHDYMSTAKLSSSVALGYDLVKSLTFGFSYNNRHKSLTPDEYYLSLQANYNSYRSSGVYTNLQVPAKYREGTVSLAFVGLQNVIAYNLGGLLSDGYYKKVANPNYDVAIKYWGVDEMTYTGFVRADVDAQLYGIPVTGNYGVQVVATHQSSDGTGANSATNAVVDTSGRMNYVDFLPSMNLSFMLDDDNIIRLSAARELVRPRMDQMSASTSYSFSSSNANSTDLANSPWSGNGGNPKLKPWRSYAVDVAYEYYFAKDAYLSLAGFYKNLESYIYQKSELYDFTGFSTNGVTPKLWDGYVTQYANGTGGNLKGVELSLSVPGSIASSWLDGFGVTFNASYTDSNIKDLSSASAASYPLPGMSRYVTNSTLYYEMNGFSVRLNHNYRSMFLGEVAGFGRGKSNREIKAQGWLDGQIGYNFEDGSLNGLGVLFQVNNITNETMTGYQNNDERQVMSWQKYGTQFLFGLTYKM